MLFGGSLHTFCEETMTEVGHGAGVGRDGHQLHARRDTGGNNQAKCHREHMEGSLPKLDGRKQVNAKPKSEVADVTYICDASSSAYQIMSYFQDLAVRTNF